MGRPRPLFTCPPSTIAWDPGVRRLWGDRGRPSLPCTEASEGKPREIWEERWASAFCLSYGSAFSSFTGSSSPTDPFTCLWKAPAAMHGSPFYRPAWAPFSVKQGVPA